MSKKVKSVSRRVWANACTLYNSLLSRVRDDVMFVFDGNNYTSSECSTILSVKDVVKLFDKEYKKKYDVTIKIPAFVLCSTLGFGEIPVVYACAGFKVKDDTGALYVGVSPDEETLNRYEYPSFSDIFGGTMLDEGYIVSNRFAVYVSEFNRVALASKSFDRDVRLWCASMSDDNKALCVTGHILGKEPVRYVFSKCIDEEEFEKHNGNYVYKYLKDILTSDVYQVDKIYWLNEGYIEGCSGSVISRPDGQKFLLLTDGGKVC